MTELVPYRSSVVTPDTAEALRRLELAGKERGGLRLQFSGVQRPLASWVGVKNHPGPLKLAPHLSMRPTGREVYLRAQLTDSKDPLEELGVLWGLAVPLGFLPWSRFPVPGESSRVFHYLGPWSVIPDMLNGEGKGELAWPSLCAAAQIDVGTWKGDRLIERTVQTHLHRLGIPCGAVDGSIGPKSLAALKALGLGGQLIQNAAVALGEMNPPLNETPSSGRQVGYFTMRSGQFEAFTSGEVHAARTRTGYAVTVSGSGRLILLFGD